jgi:hypothetical protein
VGIVLIVLWLIFIYILILFAVQKKILNPGQLWGAMTSGGALTGVGSLKHNIKFLTRNSNSWIKKVWWVRSKIKEAWWRTRGVVLCQVAQIKSEDI